MKVTAGIVCYNGNHECLEMQDPDGYVWQVFVFTDIIKYFPEVAEYIRAAKGKSVTIEISIRVAQ